MAVRGQQLTEAVRHYHALLEDESLANATAEELDRQRRKLDLFFGTRPITVSLRPHLIERAKWDHTVSASETICAALSKLEALLLDDAVLRRELDLDPEEESLILAETPCVHSSPSSRLDAFFTDELRYVEYNAESPAGMGYYDNLVEAFDRLPVMAEFRRRFRLTSMRVKDMQHQTMLESFKEWAREEKPVIAIVDWQDVPTLREHEMFCEYFESKGVKALMCDPRALELRSDGLYANGTKVNVVYRRVLTSELLSRGPEASRALCEAYRTQAACIVNTFRAKLLHRKLSLGLLTDERCAHIFTAAEQAAITRHVPWTRKLRDGSTVGPDGERISDLPAFVSTRREQLVLKPNDDYGGHGVTLGWESSSSAWSAAIQHGLQGSYVVQWKVPVPREAFPLALDTLQFAEMIVDVDPYLFRGRVNGCLTRLSASALLNVTAGAGSVVPAYVVEGSA